MPPLRAPREHTGLLAVPPLAEVGPLLHANRAAFANASAHLLELRLADARHRAAAEIIDLTQPRFTSSTNFLTTGHQPELYHPGVWVKNFAACGVAKRHSLTPLHFLVDNDIAKSSSIKVPIGNRHSARVARIAFDQWTTPAPFEELRVQDESLFATFADRVVEAMDEPGFEPLLKEFWPEAVRLGKQTPLLGERLAGARRIIEERWGCRNLEVQLSRLCQTEAFARFACHLLFDLKRFQEIHNHLLHDYRKRHGIRSLNHPVPDLAMEGDWREAPLWVWRPGDRHRERLFVRNDGSHLELRHGKTTFARLPLDPTRAIREWRHCEGRGYKLRTRALTTTMFVRLVIADMFIHGIGGAIYDELTDAIIRAFFQIEPPRFVTLSATLYLPPGMNVSDAIPTEELDRWLRRLWFSPEQFIHENDPEINRLMHEKQSWIDRDPLDPASKRERFQAILQLNDRLRPFVAEQRDALLRKQVALEQYREADAIWRNREYAFCLYPTDMLREFFQRLL